MSTKNPLAIEITNVIKTKADALHFIYKIDEVISDLFNLKIHVEELLEKKLSYTQKQFIVSVAKDNNIALNDAVSFQKFLMKLKEYATSIPDVELSLSFDPSKEIIDSISDWFKTSIKMEVFLDITIDESIMGGVLIGFNGTYKDYSLKKTLKDTIIKNPTILTIKR